MTLCIGVGAGWGVTTTVGEEAVGETGLVSTGEWVEVREKLSESWVSRRNESRNDGAGGGEGE